MLTEIQLQLQVFNNNYITQPKPSNWLRFFHQTCVLSVCTLITCVLSVYTLITCVLSVYTLITCVLCVYTLIVPRF